MTKWVKKLMVFILVLVVFSVFLFYQNNAIKLQRYNLSLPKLPESFKGFKIVQLSDMHSKRFGEGQERIIGKIKNEKPDVIFITGDVVDSSHYAEEPALELLKACKEIAPTYYVTGNHEYWSGKYEEFRPRIEAAGVNVLEDKAVDLEVKGQSIQLIGLKDPASRAEEDYSKDNISTVKDILEERALSKEDRFTILVSHRPELFKDYCDSNIDLVLSGHAHGGQVRLPIVGGIAAPDQGFFPEYDKGVFQQNDTTMIVSSGLGNSIIPQRIFNRPEIVVVTLN